MVTRDFNDRVNQFLASRNMAIDSCLGAGTQGSVFVVNILSQSSHGGEQVAVKFHEQKVAYLREIAAYLRLRDNQIVEANGHMVPQLIDFDDEFLAIQMTIVSPPFCLDFGGAYLDSRPDYSPEVWDDWRKMKSDAFEDNWPAVLQIIAKFETLGIYIADVNPGNITFVPKPT